ncbi:LLM class F420-dependent oxidoreductase [Paractinoplanes abujensis]|uniref:F420-dependent oxidoreductase-like protein n=1 Tax=Paractinoplanes abujensis TaxID=882441 RepID=A0A7W7CQD1_9ACTN|nr:LLM class F420-dependent oxidoreductase [Actinoplanes abujensis]MBB4690966.1 F420-dependent oxidoreductase-like protein [Actinoplanes abujensis]GID17621.1 LLM class F420-dependent oxidoreductase [Actinoplanes abujensis]
MSVRFGVFVPQGWKMDLVEIADPVEQYEAMTEVARVADAGPWDAIWLYDHFHTVPEPTLNSVFECWTATSTLARDTSRVRIGQMVGCNGYRQPSLYAKIASTVDVASHGRLIAGLGAGWYEHEWKAYGYEWKDVPQRMSEFREAVEIVHKMWTEDRPAFRGKHYSIDEPINQPRRKPDFWLGGGGEKVTLKLVAQYADGCNVGGGDPEVVRHKLGVLREHCDRLGRDYAAITKSTTIELDLTESTADTIARVERVAEAGADYVIFYVPRVAYDHAPLLRLAEELVPQFR